MAQLTKPTLQQFYQCNISSVFLNLSIQAYMVSILFTLDENILAPKLNLSLETDSKLK